MIVSGSANVRAARSGAWLSTSVVTDDSCVVLVI
jgi:hypothetical protein